MPKIAYIQVVIKKLQFFPGVAVDVAVAVTRRATDSGVGVFSFGCLVGVGVATGLAVGVDVGVDGGSLTASRLGLRLGPSTGLK